MCETIQNARHSHWGLRLSVLVVNNSIKIVTSFFAVYLYLVCCQAYAEEWPQGMSVVWLKDGTWKLCVVEKGKEVLGEVATESEPRTPIFNIEGGKIAYVAADGDLYEQDTEVSNNNNILKADSEHAYTQPAYDPSGEHLYIVELKEGASVDTDILVLDKTRRKNKPVVIQRSAQFEPNLPQENELFYSNVLCTMGCAKIIQEIWHMNILSGEAEQVTLMNSISRQPFLSFDGKWLYFSSNKKGNFHIWRMNLASNNYEQITDGVVTDVNPVLDKSNYLYFIRRSPQAIRLMRMSPSGELRPMVLPEGITDLRDLGMSY